jgi:hypothetical protein
MKKTNLRINNRFIIHDNNSYFLSDTDMLSDWQTEKIKKKGLQDVTALVNECLEESNIHSNVNFIIDKSRYEMSGGR